jgi:predicted enzyme involved in methoxymalonyl-ACP biosynthesis
VLQEILHHAKRTGIRKLVGKYIPTERNQLVVQHYANLGFQHVGLEVDGTTTWELDVPSAQIKSCSAEIRRFGFDVAEVAKA